LYFDPVQKTPFIMMVIILLLSFCSGMTLVGRAYTRTAPYWLFGKEAVRRDNIRVIRETRQTITFSNDPSNPIRLRELWPLNFLFTAARLVAIILIFFAISRLTVSILKRVNPQWAQELARATTPR
jgi:hypothetical protein